MKLSYGKQKYKVEVQFNIRKRLAITVYPDLQIIVKAPEGLDADDILRRVKKRLPWIKKQTEYFKRFFPLPAPRKYVSGETHYYLGRQYRLRVRHGDKAGVRLIGRFFEVSLPETYNHEQVKRLMLDWYSYHAKNILLKRIEEYLPKFLRKSVIRPEVRFRRMKKRWGSCSNNGVIMLNTELVKAPSQCIDYVIVHELCHLLHPNHDKNFYSFLNKILPDWEQRKLWLEKVAI